MNVEQYNISKYNLYFMNDSEKKYIWNSVTNVLKNVDELDYFQMINGNCGSISDEKKKDFLESGFLIGVCVDETQDILRKINYRTHYARPHYRILTTTGCNATCSYCYEKGLAVQKMEGETAEAVADFIIGHSNGVCSVLEWFGGEPLMNPYAINTICEKLRRHGLHYKSIMESNGTLFDNNLISHAVELWGLKRVQITLDGVGKIHEQVKGIEKGAFAKIIHNIHRLLDVGIKVSIRIIHIGDIVKESELIRFLDKEFSAENKRPTVYISPLYGVGKSYKSDYIKQIIRLNRILLETNFATVDRLYDLSKYSGRCFATTINGYTIAPDGTLYNCSHNMSSAQRTGTIWASEDTNQVRSEFISFNPSEECRNCVMFPICQGGCRVAEMKLAPMTQCHIWKNVIKDILKIKLNLQDSLI